MSKQKALQWAGKNLSLGGLVKHSATAIGTLTSYTVRGAGYAASQLADDPDKRKSIQESTKNAGQAIGAGFSKGGSALGGGINKSVQLAGKAGGNAGAGIARMAGASEETIASCRKIGAVATAGGIGLIAGFGVADALVAVAAVGGTAGAAATTSGLAALGGGSVVTGGGGMAVGLAVSQTIVATGFASGAASLNEEVNKPIIPGIVD